MYEYMVFLYMVHIYCRYAPYTMGGVEGGREKLRNRAREKGGARLHCALFLMGYILSVRGGLASCIMSYVFIVIGTLSYMIYIHRAYALRRVAFTRQRNDFPKFSAALAVRSDCQLHTTTAISLKECPSRQYKNLEKECEFFWDAHTHFIPFNF